MQGALASLEAPLHLTAAGDEARLAALARAPVALRRALARVAGRMLATRGWERLGFARLADYAAERAGVSARELRDLARVDAALAELPGLEAAFLGGRIGWTKLRLLCRVARPEDEASWLALAEAQTAVALAREVRAVDRRAREAAAGGWDGADADEARVGVVLRCSPRARARWWHARRLACRVAGQKLSAGAFAEALAGEVLSALPLADAAPDEGAKRKVRGESEEGSPPVSCVSLVAPPLPGSPAEAAPKFVAALERGLDDADAFELDARLRRALRLEAQCLARVAPLLERVAVGRLYRDLGFRSLDAYAEERLGMAPSRARALLRIERTARGCPPLRAAFAAGQLSWVQAHALVPLLLEAGATPHRAAWVAHAQAVSVRRLDDDVEAALASGSFAPPGEEATAMPVDRAADLQIGAIARSRTERVRVFFAAEAEVARLFRATLATVQRRLERRHGRPSSESEALEAMLDHAVDVWSQLPTEGGTRRRRPPPEHRIFERDGWRCSVPGCSSYRNLHAHHVVFRSAGGSDASANLTTLCAWHHLRGVHAGTVRCSGRAPHALRFELGRRPRHPALVAYAPGERLDTAPAPYGVP